MRYLDGSRLGTLCIIDTSPRTMDAEGMKTLKDLAELAERELAAAELATLDDLTRISNRRGFITLGQHSLNMCVRQKIPASLVFLDLNAFKNINDEYGHAEGDKVLTTFADHMRNTFRGSDVFARLGGDEFVVLLANTSAECAEEIIRRFRQSLETYYQKTKHGYDITFSEGIVTVESDQSRQIEMLLNRADTLMYEKKQEMSDSSGK